MGTARHPHDSRRPESAAVKLGVEIFREEGDIEPLRSALSPRQRAFCEEYVVDFCGKAAVIRAGYSKNYADRMGSALLRNKGVAAYIDFLSQSKEAKITAIDPDYVIAKVTAIVGREETKDGDKLRGLELLARHLGMFIDRTEITGKDGGPLETRRIEEDAEQVRNVLKSLRERKLKEEVKEVTIV